MTETKPLPPDEVASALALAERCRAAREPEEAESMCLDILEVEPENQAALALLLLARTDLFERGSPHGVERAREVLPRLVGEYERAYYGGVICERQAKYLLGQRGRRTGFVAWEWFHYAMEQFEEALRLDPSRPEARLRWNTCVRLIARNRHCVPPPDEIGEHGIE